MIVRGSAPLAQPHSARQVFCGAGPGGHDGARQLSGIAHRDARQDGGLRWRCRPAPTRPAGFVTVERATPDAADRSAAVASGWQRRAAQTRSWAVSLTVRRPGTALSVGRRLGRVVGAASVAAPRWAQRGGRGRFGAIGPGHRGFRSVVRCLGVPLRWGASTMGAAGGLGCWPGPRCRPDRGCRWPVRTCARTRCRPVGRCHGWGYLA